MKREVARDRIASLRNGGLVREFPGLGMAEVWIDADETGKERLNLRLPCGDELYEAFGYVEAFGSAFQEAYLASLPYEEYLATEHWQAIRSNALHRANHRCQLCNEVRGALHVHHRTYERIGREEPGDVIALCARCHERFHTADPE